MNAPATITDVITLMNSPLCSSWMWTRREGKQGARLTVFHDDMDRDTRTVVEIVERPGAAPVIYTHTVTGYNPTRNAWTSDQQRRTTYAPDRRGWSKIVDRAKAIALATKGYPNPAHVTYDRTNNATP